MPLKVSAAVIIKRDRVFIARRAKHKDMAGKWEFPGGKIEPGETPKQSLEREILEEFGVRIRVDRYLSTVYHQYPAFQIELIVFYARFLEGKFRLTDHDKIAWVESQELVNYDLAEADIPIIELLND